jgi:hypothetical protein
METADAAELHEPIVPLCPFLLFPSQDLVNLREDKQWLSFGGRRILKESHRAPNQAEQPAARPSPKTILRRRTEAVRPTQKIWGKSEFGLKIS